VITMSISALSRVDRVVAPSTPVIAPPCAVNASGCAYPCRVARRIRRGHTSLRTQRPSRRQSREVVV
jgi:hypothetical protein